MAAAYVLLGRLVEIRQDVHDDPGRFAALERRRADQMVDEVVVRRRTDFEHTLILGAGRKERKKSARYRARVALYHGR